MAAPARDYYEVLGVPRTATEKEIQAAFRKLAREHHPDVNPGDPSAADRFKEINEAREVLSDPEKRRRYDRLGPDRRRDDAPPPDGASTGPRDRPSGQGARVEYPTGDPHALEGLVRSGSPVSDIYHDMFWR